MYGSLATTVESALLDNSVNRASLLAFEIVSKEINGLTYQAKLTKDQIPGNIGACKPDGGVWFLNGKAILAVEAKHQLDRGNAIERWFKNQFILRAINPKLSYITFASGSGVLEGNPIYNTLHIAHMDGYNVNVVNGNTAYLCENGFTVDQMVNVIRDIAIATIKGE